MLADGSSDGNDSTVVSVSGDVDDEIVLVVASWIESSGRFFDLTACADEDEDLRDDVDDDEAISLRLRDDRKKKDFRFFRIWFFDVTLLCLLQQPHTKKLKQKSERKMFCL